MLFTYFLIFCVIANFQSYKMLFISKTVRDRGISGKIWTHRVLSTTPLAPLKNLDFFKFQPPPWILVEMENVIYLENRKR